MNASQTTYTSHFHRSRTRGVILVLESDKLIRNWLHWVLRSRGYKALTASTLQEAEAHLYHIGANQLDLVMVDVSFKVASEGRKLYQAWKPLFPTLPFLLMSEEDITAEVNHVYNETVDFLIKRFLISELMEKIRNLTASKAAA